MFAVQTEDAAQIDDTGTVQLKFDDCRSARRRSAQDHLEIITPVEMLFPLMAARVVQRGDLTTFRVQTLRAGELVVVASLAGKSQIIQPVRPAMVTGKYMFCRKRPG